MKKFIYIGLVLIVILIFIFIPKKTKLTYEYNVPLENGTILKRKLEYRDTSKVTNYVKIDTSMGLIFVELYPDIAPITVKNFKELVREGFYKNMIFHRVIENFMIQTGSGVNAEKIKGEFSSNGIENNLKHLRGVVSMARATGFDTASSQFFIVQKDTLDLDGKYAAFGKVLAGLEVVDKIATVETDDNDKPINDVKLNSITFVEI